MDTVIVENPKNGEARSFSVENGVVKTLVCAGCCNEQGITSARKARAEGLYYEYNNGKVVCPRCGRELTVIKTVEEINSERAARKAAIEAERLANLQLYEASWDLSTGIRFYGLTARVERDIWKKIAKYFRFYNGGWSEYEDADFTMSAEPAGWLTTQPGEVEKILVAEGLIKESNTLAARRAAEKERAEKARKAADEKLAAQKKANELKKEFMKAFKGNTYVETHKGETYSVKEFESGDVLETHEDALQDRTSYFGGVFYIICESKIWKVHTNDNWEYHNVKFEFDERTFEGEGYYIPYDAETADLIKEYCSFAKKAKGL